MFLANQVLKLYIGVEKLNTKLQVLRLPKTFRVAVYNRECTLFKAVNLITIIANIRFRCARLLLQALVKHPSLLADIVTFCASKAKTFFQDKSLSYLRKAALIVYATGGGRGFFFQRLVFLYPSQGPYKFS